MQILYRFPLHSFILSMYPICYLYSQNAMYIDSDQTLRPLALALGFSVFFLLVFRLILRDWLRAGLLTTLIIGLFFSFGHVATLIGPLMTGGGIPYKESFLGGAWILGFLILSFGYGYTKFYQRDIACGPTPVCHQD